jgi:hypothetical protein
MAIPRLFVVADMGVIERWLAMGVCSASDIPAFRQHATILILTSKMNTILRIAVFLYSVHRPVF